MPHQPTSTPSEEIAAIIRVLLARVPAWVRADLSSKDPGARLRAEETLAAMIEAALGGKDHDPSA